MRGTGPIRDLIERIASYQPVVVAVELILIWLVVYAIFRFVQGTRAAGALKGLLVLLVATTVISRVLGGAEAFQRLAFLYDRFVALALIGLVVIFQPELRRALVRLGETPFFRSGPSDVVLLVDELVDAAVFLSKAKFGALVVLERNVGVAGLVEGGTVLNADLSARLLQTIFFPGSALHDLAVVVKGRSVFAAGVQLPLADPSDMPDPRFGSRHRAAVGLTKECDAIALIVSEETGRIRLAERGRLSDPLDEDALRKELLARLAPTGPRGRRTPAPDELQITDLEPAAPTSSNGVANGSGGAAQRDVSSRRAAREASS